MRFHRIVALLLVSAVVVGFAMLLWRRGETRAPQGSSAAPTERTSNAPPSSPVAARASASPAETENASAATSKWDAYPPRFQDCRQDGDVLDCGSCRLDSDCSAAEACILDPHTRRWGCAPSQCAADADCGAKEACLSASDPNFGNGSVRRCVAGAQQRGDECNVLPSAFPAVNCQRGLVCVDGSCQEKCTPAAAAACPEGVCLDTENGAGCLVTCKTRGCRDGYECVDVDDEPLCVQEGSCLSTGCESGQKCAGQGDGKRWVYRCITPCDPFHDTCGDGFFCGTAFGANTCVQRCDPQDLESCPAGQVCGSSADEPDRWGCLVSPR